MSYEKIIYLLIDKHIPNVNGKGIISNILERAGFQNQFSNMESVDNRSKKQIDFGAIPYGLRRPALLG